MVRSRRLPPSLVRRARIALLAGEGQSNRAVARHCGVSAPVVSHWRRRYQARGLAGLHDELRPGRPRTHDDQQVAELIKLTKCRTIESHFLQDYFQSLLQPYPCLQGKFGKMSRRTADLLGSQRQRTHHATFGHPKGQYKRVSVIVYPVLHCYLLVFERACERVDGISAEAPIMTDPGRWKLALP